LKRKTRTNIVNIIGISIFVLFAGGLLYLVIFNDPITETEYDTGNPKTSLIIREHMKTGQKEYLYGVVDGVGSSDP
jgi:hypothetical protein